MNSKQRIEQVGLALGSGGARGWAHLGAVKALREHGIRVECIAGSSMGALVGAFIAAGSEDILYELAMHLDWNRVRSFLWEISLSRSGLTDGHKLFVEAEKLLGVKEFRKLGIPFRAVATDLRTGKEAVLGSGNLLNAIRASISIPGLFSPACVGKRLMVDGGLINPVPVNVARAMGASVVLAVDVSQGIAPDSILQEPAKALQPSPPLSERPLQLPKTAHSGEEAGAIQMLEHFFSDVEKKAKRLYAAAKGPSMVDILVRSIRISEAQLALMQRQLNPPDILVEVPVGYVGTLEFQHAAKAIELGYRATNKALEAYSTPY
ncbi:MAG: patatin-like phospholipase family protein [Verrucomicrobiota bacterium]|jgi:NTE family protein|nr:patatin-like phospholipase family protein [Verrucomicrobiota bacterium]